jgi:hypothetical protein
MGKNKEYKRVSGANVQEREHIKVVRIILKYDRISNVKLSSIF